MSDTSAADLEMMARLTCTILKLHLDIGDLHDYITENPNTVAGLVLWASAYFHETP